MVQSVEINIELTPSESRRVYPSTLLCVYVISKLLKKSHYLLFYLFGNETFAPVALVDISNNTKHIILYDNHSH